MSNNSKPEHGDYQNSSGCSSVSSSMDLKCQKSQKRPKQQNAKRNEQPPNATLGSNTGRSRSFLHCLGKHLGRHFPQHQIYQLRNERGRVSNVLATYNSEEDVHSSSTDSFSLSYERYTATAQTNAHMHGCGGGVAGGSTADLTGEERSSGTSSAASAYSRLSSNTAAAFNGEIDEMWPKRHERYHYYLDTSNMYRRPASVNTRDDDDDADDDDDNDDNDDEADYSDNSQGDDHDADNDNDSDDDNNRATAKRTTNAKQRRSSNATNAAESNVIRVAPKKKSAITAATIATTTSTSTIKCKSQKNATSATSNIATPPPSRSRSTSPCSITKGLHLSRISIASSVCRMFQHFSINSSSSTATSTRSLSCSSTPLHGSSSFKMDNKKAKNTNNNNNNSNQNRCNSKRSTTPQTRSTSFSIGNSNTNCNSSSNANSNKKKEKKQQSILRPPVSYVYMKGMSGLYSRVPRYTVCCPYQAA